MGGQARSEMIKCCELLARQSQPTLEMEVLGKRSLNIKPKTGKIIPPSFYLKLDLLKTKDQCEAFKIASLQIYEFAD